MSTSITQNDINTDAQSKNPLAAAFAATAHAFAKDSLINGVTWNGDINYSSLGSTFEAALLALDQKMVLPEECRKTATLDDSTRTLLDGLVDTVLDTIKQATKKLKSTTEQNHERAKAFSLVFRYLFYLRSVRVAGKKSRLLFYYLFERIHTLFPLTCCQLISLIPEFGYFGDLDVLIEKMKDQEDIVSAIEKVYVNHLNTDCQLIFGKQLSQITKDEASALNLKLKDMTVEQVRTFVGNKRLSLAAKWFKREGKKNSSHREQFLISIYFPNGGVNDLKTSTDRDTKALVKRRIDFIQMLFRNVISALSQLILVGEQMMCESDSEHRTWEDIPMDAAPAVFLTKYRKALANEVLKEDVPEHQIDTGNRHPENKDRVQARKNLLKALIDGKLKGAAQDIERLSKIIFEHISHGSISTKLSWTERQVIAAQWTDIVTKLKTEIVVAIEKSRQDATESSEIFLDPRNVIPVVDTSGSMNSAKVQDKAIGLGILASHLSSMPGCLISFSETPEVFHLDMSKKCDVFDHFLTIVNGPTGLSTNVDGTYKVLLDLMVSSGVKETDFALMYLTDGQFNEQANLPQESTSAGSYSYGYGYQRNSSTPMQRFQKTFIGRLEAAFKAKGYNLPRTIFWNLNCTSPGFPVDAESRGFQLVSGYSQSLMIQVFTGDYKYEVQADGSVKVSVTPWESFLKAIMNQGYDPVMAVVSAVGENCFKA